MNTSHTLKAVSFVTNDIFKHLVFHLYPIKICVINFDAFKRKISLSVDLDKATIKAANVQSQL